MFRFPSFRLLAALLLTAAFLFPGPAAAGPLQLDSALGSLAPGDLLTRLGSLFLRFWNKEGCIIDPHGACVASPSSPQTKEGCGIDPHGLCVASPSNSQTKAGCVIDPHGGCGT